MSAHSDWFVAADGAKVKVIDHYDGGKAATLFVVGSDGSQVNLRLEGQAFRDFVTEIEMLDGQRDGQPQTRKQHTGIRKWLPFLGR